MLFQWRTIRPAQTTFLLTCTSMVFWLNPLIPVPKLVKSKKVPLIQHWEHTEPAQPQPQSQPAWQRVTDPFQVHMMSLDFGRKQGIHLKSISIGSNRWQVALTQTTERKILNLPALPTLWIWASTINLMKVLLSLPLLTGLH